MEEEKDSGRFSRLINALGLKRERRDLVREMVELIEEGSAEGVINSDEEEMLRSVLDFKRTLVREVMIPRTEFSTIEVSSPLSELIALIIREGHSRIPVYEHTIDRMVGVVHARDLLPYWGKGEEPVKISGLMRPVYFVPETMGIETLLKELKRRKTHLAVVVDEYGGVSGLVTLENVLEEIVGDIQDEYDEEEERQLFRRVAGGVEVDGRADVELVEDELDVKIEAPGEFETVGGLVFSVMGRIPRTGESFTLGGRKFVIRSADERRVKSVFISDPENAGEGAPNDK